MKFWKIPVILVAVIGISAGVYFGVSKSIEKKEAEEVVSSGVGTFLEFNSDEITSISFTSSEGTFDFTSEDGASWTCTNQDMRVNNNTIIYAIYAMSALDTTKLIEENSSDLSKYGLDNPISVSCSDGSESYDIQIGNTSPTGESYYIKSPDNNDIYTITAAEGAAIHADKTDLKNRFIIDSYVSAVNKIIYTADDKVIFNCQKNDSGAWELIEPQVSNVEVNLSKISAIADLLIRADVIDFISESPTDEELAEYGLDNPKYKIEISDDDENNTLYLGNSPEDNVIYAQFGDTKEVATFYMGEIGIIGYGTEAVVDDILYEDKKENITNLQVTYNSQTIDIGVNYNSDDRSYSYTKDDSTINDESYYSLVNKLVNSSLQIPLDSIKLDDIPNGEPILTITYTRNYEPNAYKLEFIPTDEDAKYYYVLMDGQYKGCIVRSRDLSSDDYIIGAIKNVLEYQIS